MRFFYDREGREIDWERLCDLLDDHEYRQVARTRQEDYLVSTAWLGIDLGTGVPMLFETVVIGTKFGDPETYYRERYHTESAALRGHQAVVSAIAVIAEVEKLFEEL